ncbi:unnamed protein product [Bursaphelenchus okinawaensis]|uniref:Ubiquitin-like protein ATG12 n=1 Tax=Bursaphelenchus okinawaensis TaxID=465554 RepID=A0A811JU31_9BILA|nr:unnamed protein product [Bursaphelenchus okinawaensis]CAG9083228.1 unnamed protein product [Bursaphelenchus okinawaensis]
MSAFDINSKATNPKEQGLFDYWYLQYCLTTGAATDSKVAILLKAVGNTPILKNKNWTLEGTNTVAWLICFIRRYLKLPASQSLFIFVNQAFSPSPDQTIANLQHCYAPSGQKLVLHYSTTNAWG